MISSLNPGRRSAPRRVRGSNHLTTPRSVPGRSDSAACGAGAESTATSARRKRRGCGGAGKISATGCGAATGARRRTGFGAGTAALASAASRGAACRPSRAASAAWTLSNNAGISAIVVVRFETSRATMCATLACSEVFIEKYLPLGPAPKRARVLLVRSGKQRQDRSIPAPIETLGIAAKASGPAPRGTG